MLFCTRISCYLLALRLLLVRSAKGENEVCEKLEKSSHIRIDTTANRLIILSHETYLHSQTIFPSFCWFKFQLFNKNFFRKTRKHLKHFHISSYLPAEWNEMFDWCIHMLPKMEIFEKIDWVEIWMWEAVRDDKEIVRKNVVSLRQCGDDGKFWLSELHASCSDGIRCSTYENIGKKC